MTKVQVTIKEGQPIKVRVSSSNQNVNIVERLIEDIQSLKVVNDEDK